MRATLTSVLFIIVSLAPMSDTQHAGKYLWKEWIHLCYIHVCSLVGPTRTLVSENVQILAANVISEPFGWVQLVKWHSKAASLCPVLLYSLCLQVSGLIKFSSWNRRTLVKKAQHCSACLEVPG